MRMYEAYTDVRDLSCFIEILRSKDEEFLVLKDPFLLAINLNWQLHHLTISNFTPKKLNF